MLEIQAPNALPDFNEKDVNVEYSGPRYVFLAGSIEMGVAEEWQKRVKQILEEKKQDKKWILLNPRRDNWDASWEQKKENTEFSQQVLWELSALERADKVLMYFDPETKSPISLLELGLFGRSPGKMIVVCPEGFWRKGNIDIVCERYGIQQTESIEAAIDILTKNS